MKVINRVHPTPAQTTEFFSMPEDGMFVMVDLLNIKTKGTLG